jgi:ubiquinone/menaquinone biosynthesis C-methylase UbiE
MLVILRKQQTAHRSWVRESAFGEWFLGTDTWINRVLKVAVDELQSLMPQTMDAYPTILDVGYGHGHSLLMLDERFRPEKIIGLDIDDGAAERSAKKAEACGCDVQLVVGSATAMELHDASVDMVFCHQTLHHISDQAAATAEFRRVLKPGGVLLLAESCKKFIYSVPVKLLFRHPMRVQKTDKEYVQLLRDSGFEIPPGNVSRPYYWWSRRDLGLFELLGRKIPEDKEETQVNIVAYRPA